LRRKALRIRALMTRMRRCYFTEAPIVDNGSTYILTKMWGRGKLATVLGRLLSVKDAAHYGVLAVSARKATDAKRWAELLVQRAAEESER
jgi:hypothetical protein